MEEQDNLNCKYIKVEVQAKIEATVKEIIRIGIGQTINQIVDRGQFRQDGGRSRFEQSYRETIEKIQETMAEKIAEENTEKQLYE